MPLTPHESLDISSSVEPYFPCHVDALRDMLATAEKVFGERDYGYSVAAVEFAGDRPMALTKRFNREQTDMLLPPP